MKIEIDLKGVEGNEEITKAIIEKIQNSPQVEGLDQIVEKVIKDYMVQTVVRKLEYGISSDEVRNTYREVCREKVNEFCNVAFDKEKEQLETEVGKIADSIKNQFVDIFVSVMFSHFLGKMQFNEMDMKWQIVNQIKNDLRNGVL